MREVKGEVLKVTKGDTKERKVQLKSKQRDGLNVKASGYLLAC